MKNRFKVYIFLSCLLLSCCLMSGCVNRTIVTKDENINFKPINNELYYYLPTGVIYIIFNEASGNQGYGYMAPYYNDNGKLCKYDASTNSIVEIEN